MSPLGLTAEETWRRLSEGESGIRFVTRFDTNKTELRGISVVPFGRQVAGDFEHIAGSPKDLDRWPEPALYAVRAVCGRLINRVSLVESGCELERVGLIGATALTSQISQDAIQKSMRPNIKFIL